MKRAGWFLLLGGLVFAGCDTMHNVAVSSFRVLDAPANYIRHHLDTDEPARTTTTTTTTVSADSSAGGHPVNVERSSATNSQRHVATSSRSSASSRSTRSDSASAKPKASPSPSPHKTASQQQQQQQQAAQFPTAKAVPGKPGYVFSPFDSKGGYVDVSGYPSGAKVKDPYANKIFLVP
ncbi:MAG: hypothetical protein QOI04_568 [Verrucomicrobiota bacterium]|jgi:hypothetical protein